MEKRRKKVQPMKERKKEKSKKGEKMRK